MFDFFKNKSSGNPLKVDPLSRNGIMNLKEQRRLQESKKNEPYDIYNKQQLVRGDRDIGEEKDFFFPLILSTVISFIVFVLVRVLNFLYRYLKVTNEKTLEVKQFSFVSRIFISLFAGAIVFLVAYHYINRTNSAKNVLARNDDINDYENDGHIMLPKEIIRQYPMIPDSYIHFNGTVTAIIAHYMLSNDKKTRKITVALPLRGPEGNVILEDNNGNRRESSDITGYSDRKTGDHVIFEERKLPLFDTEKAHRIYDVAKVPQNLRQFYSVDDFIDETGKNYLKEEIENNWYLPTYEHGRPSGVYASMSNPGHLLLVTSSRGGKDAVVLNVLRDVIRRTTRQPNFVGNDTKMEAFVEHARMFEASGYEPLQFNLLIPENTDVYNTFGPSIESTRSSRFEEVSQHLEIIGQSIFTNSGSSDRFWTDGSNNIFKRQSLELDNFLIHEENFIAYQGRENKRTDEFVNTRIDELWGYMIPSNLYYVVSDLISKITSDPDLTIFTDAVSEDGKADLMSILFDGMIDLLPENILTRFAMNAHNALSPLMNSPKTRGSVFGVALTGLSFFVDPISMRLTTGRPSQSLDLESLSFPRMIAVKFSYEALKHMNLFGHLAVWTAYRDEKFSDEYNANDYYYERIIDNSGWAYYYVRGKFESKVTYLELSVKNLNSENRYEILNLRFKLKLEYKKDLTGENYVVKDGNMFIQGGSLTLLSEPYYDKFLKTVLRDNEGNPKTKMVKRHIYYVDKTKVRYFERSKAIFLITPPHLMIYQKMIITILTQILDSQLAVSYTAFSDQKPLTSTYYDFNEYGNLQAEGKGIEKMPTWVTAGLAQEQFIWFGIQALQQIKKMHTNDVWSILKSNSNCLMFLKSNDKELITELAESSGVTHNSHINNKTVQIDLKEIVPTEKTNGKVQYSKSTSEKTVLQKNDFLYLSKEGNLGNAISLINGAFPVVARNELVMPTYFTLNRDRNIAMPKLAGALIKTNDGISDLSRYRLNTDNYFKKRIDQYKIAPYATVSFNEKHAYTLKDIDKMDDNFYSQELMLHINILVDKQRKIKEEVSKFQKDLEKYAKRNQELQDYKGYYKENIVTEDDIDKFYFLFAILSVKFDTYEGTKKGERFELIHSNVTQKETLILLRNFLRKFDVLYSDLFKELVIEKSIVKINQAKIISKILEVLANDLSNDNLAEKAAETIEILNAIVEVDDKYKIALSYFTERINGITFSQNIEDFYPISVFSIILSEIEMVLTYDIDAKKIKAIKQKYALAIENTTNSVVKVVEDMLENDLKEIDNGTIDSIDDHLFEINEEIQKDIENSISVIPVVQLSDEFSNTSLIDNFAINVVKDKLLVSALSIVYENMLEEDSLIFDDNFILNENGDLFFSKNVKNEAILSENHLEFVKEMSIAGIQLVTRQVMPDDEYESIDDMAKSDIQSFTFDNANTELNGKPINNVDDITDELGQDYIEENAESAMDTFAFNNLFLTILADPSSNYFIRTIMGGELLGNLIDMYSALNDGEE